MNHAAHGPAAFSSDRITVRVDGDLDGRDIILIPGLSSSPDIWQGTVDHLTAQDGVVSVALGLGKTVVEGGNSVRFCPRYPDKMMDAVAPSEVLDAAQTSFFALDMTKPAEGTKRDIDPQVKRYQLASAEEDGRRVFDDTALAQIAGGNFLRVLSSTSK